MKEISIIIPHYNSWDYLEELIKSIPRNRNIEIIVVDDNSKDFNIGVSKINSLVPEVKFYKNSSGFKGAGAARNKGIAYSTGRWLLFADADDIFTKDAFNVLDKYLNSSYDIVYFRPTSFINGTNNIGIRHKQYDSYIYNYLENDNLYNEMKIRYYYLVPWSKLIRKELVDKHKISFEEIIVSNDILFSAKTGYYAKNIKVDSSVIYSARESSTSLTADISEKRFRERFLAWRDYVNFLDNHLKDNEKSKLGISSLPQIYIILKNKLGFSNLIFVLKESFINGIPLLNWKRLVDKVFNRLY